MHKLPRKKALNLIRAAGTEGNHRAFMRLYVENRISYPVALAEYRKGVEMAKRGAAREPSLPMHTDAIEEIYAERAIINAA